MLHIYCIYCQYLLYILSKILYYKDLDGLYFFLENAITSCNIKVCIIRKTCIFCTDFSFFNLHFAPQWAVSITSVLNRKNGFAVGKIGAKVAVAQSHE